MAKVSKQAKSRMLVFGTISIISIIFFIISFISSIKTIYNLENETNARNKLYNELLASGEELENFRTKLQDPEQLAKFARENYDYSKDGELIIKIVDANKNIEDLNEKNDNNKIILIVISLIMLFMIFVYIFLKSRSIKKINKDLKRIK